MPDTANPLTARRPENAQQADHCRRRSEATRFANLGLDASGLSAIARRLLPRRLHLPAAPHLVQKKPPSDQGLLKSLINLLAGVEASMPQVMFIPPSDVKRICTLPFDAGNNAHPSCSSLIRTLAFSNLVRLALRGFLPALARCGVRPRFFSMAVLILRAPSAAGSGSGGSVSLGTARASLRAFFFSDVGAASACACEGNLAELSGQMRSSQTAREATQ